MERDTIDALLDVLKRAGIATLDVTGGAPELNPHFRHLVRSARALGCHVIVRSNLAILSEDGMEDLTGFYRDQMVEVVASLPYYLSEQVDRVRGEHAFAKSIAALRRLNSLGFGNGDPRLPLTLVYNPQGMFLPPCQRTLEAEYRRELDKRYGITFSRLFTLANMPLGRFRNALVERRLYDNYLGKLRSAFNSSTLEGLMCRHLINVGWDGTLYDCDFNQMAGLALTSPNPASIMEFDPVRLLAREIATAEHCYGCTAGQGSTCGGAVA
jgi:radical SAM/Cys-rich protein